LALISFSRRLESVPWGRIVRPSITHLTLGNIARGPLGTKLLQQVFLLLLCSVLEGKTLVRQRSNGYFNDGRIFDQVRTVALHPDEP
jgi:hypothetical protein